MKLPAYANYKPSGVEWLGKVPEHWTIIALKHRCQQFALYGANIPAEDYSSSGIRFLRTSDINDFGELHPGGVFIEQAQAMGYLLNDGDILLSRSGTIGRAFVYSSARHPDSAYAGYLVRFVPSRELNSRFVLYFTKSLAFRDWLDTQVIASTIGNVNGQKYAQCPLALPDRAEQDKIADFLDRKTAKIDALVAKKRTLIERLKEKRTALISCTVTRGLPPDAARAAGLAPHPRFKPSGVNALGEVPEHWTSKRLMHLTDPKRPIMYGIVLPGPNVDDGVAIVKGGDVKPGRLRLENLCKTTFEIESAYARSRIQANDIVFSIRGTVGEAELVPMEIEGANLTQDAARIAPASTINCRWLLYAVKTKAVIDPLLALSLGAAVRGVNIRDLKRVWLPVAPRAEQIAIADFLDRETTKIDDMVTKVRLAIERLQEYRGALITAAVTGKIDVRNIAR